MDHQVHLREIERMVTETQTALSQHRQKQEQIESDLLPLRGNLQELEAQKRNLEEKLKNLEDDAQEASKTLGHLEDKLGQLRELSAAVQSLSSALEKRDENNLRRFIREIESILVKVQRILPSSGTESAVFSPAESAVLSFIPLAAADVLVNAYDQYATQQQDANQSENAIGAYESALQHCTTYNLRGQTEANEIRKKLIGCKEKLGGAESLVYAAVEWYSVGDLSNQIRALNKAALIYEQEGKCLQALQMQEDILESALILQEFERVKSSVLHIHRLGFGNDELREKEVRAYSRLIARLEEVTQDEEGLMRGINLLDWFSDWLDERGLQEAGDEARQKRSRLELKRASLEKELLND